MAVRQIGKNIPGGENSKCKAQWNQLGLLEEQKEGQVLSGRERSMRKVTEKAESQILYRLEDQWSWEF